MIPKQLEGFNIIPLSKSRKAPLIKELTPYINGEKYPHKMLTKTTNYGVMLGESNGNLVIIDVDDPVIYPAFYEKEHTFTVQTPDKGYHLYYIVENITCNRITKYNGWDVDILTKGYAVIPPSEYGKKKYKIIKNVEIQKIINIEEKLKPLKRKKRSIDVERFKDEISIRNIINQYTNIDKQGFAKCPFHSDTHPSLKIYDKGQRQSDHHWYCFGCQVGGDVITFIEKIENCGFQEAIQILSEKTGTEIPFSNSSIEKPVEPVEIEKYERKINIKLPDNHFITHYTKWLSSLTDGYYEYQVLAGLWLLSTITHGKIKLRLKTGTIKPNIWGFCIGSSTSTRKSTIIEKTRTIFEASTEQKSFNDDYSIEGYLELLEEKPVNSFVRDEAAGLLAKMKKKYNEGIFEAECAIYDGQNYRKTLAAGKNKSPKIYEISNPYVTKLYATTPDNLTRYLTADEFLCGYGFRFLYAYPNYVKERRPLMMETEEDISAWGEVVTRVKTLFYYFNENEIDFEVENGVMEYFDGVMSYIEERIDKESNEMFKSAMSRSEIHVLKIAMLLEIGKKPLNTTITMESITAACDLVFGFFLPCEFELISMIGEEDKFNKISKIEKNLRRFGRTASHSKLLRYTHLTSSEFNECISTMISSGAIKVIENGKTYYSLVDSVDYNLLREFTPIHRFNTFHAINIPINREERKCELCELCEGCEIYERSENPPQQEILRYIIDELRTYNPHNYEIAINTITNYIIEHYKLTTEQAEQYIKVACEENGIKVN